MINLKAKNGVSILKIIIVLAVIIIIGVILFALWFGFMSLLGGLAA